MPDIGAFDARRREAGVGGAALAVAGLRLEFGTHAARARVIDIEAWSVPAGATVGITGASGAGKTSLLHLLAGIERPSAGSIRWGETALEALPEAALDRWRRQAVGLVFQEFHLVDGLSAADNILLSCRFAKWAPTRAERQRAAALMARTGIGAPERRVETMSRGERQRTALCRALLMRPAIVLADEPTASLDAAAAAAVREMLIELAREIGATLVVASHDQALLGAMQHRYGLMAGRFEPLL